MAFFSPLHDTKQQQQPTTQANYASVTRLYRSLVLKILLINEWTFGPFNGLMIEWKRKPERERTMKSSFRNNFMAVWGRIFRSQHKKKRETFAGYSKGFPFIHCCLLALSVCPLIPFYEHLCIAGMMRPLSINDFVVLYPPSFRFSFRSACRRQVIKLLS